MTANESGRPHARRSFAHGGCIRSVAARACITILNGTATTEPMQILFLSLAVNLFTVNSEESISKQLIYLFNQALGHTKLYYQ